MKLILAGLGLAIGLAGAGEKKVPDLTGAEAKTFHSRVGGLISLQGRLEQGMQGACLNGGTGKDVVFYIVPDQTAARTFRWPEAWTRLTNHEVRVTGELKFRAFDRRHFKPGDQSPADYYYMVLQQTRLEKAPSK